MQQQFCSQRKIKVILVILIPTTIILSKVHKWFFFHNHSKGTERHFSYQENYTICHLSLAGKEEGKISTMTL